MPADLTYILLLFFLLVVPRFLQRYRLPPAIVSLVFGVAASQAGLIPSDTTLPLLATLGIVTLFLLAGLEVKVSELRRVVKMLAMHLFLQICLLSSMAWIAHHTLQLQPRAALLLALALFTPSTGFILDSMDSLGLSDEERFWTRSKAIASEMLALGLLFFALQSTSPQQLAFSTLALAGLVVAIPLTLHLIATWLVPYAPRSEFAFLIMVAVVCAYATKKLGVYYLVGAFLVGVAAQRFREQLPALSSERMLHAIEAFASVFVPFYFFKAGIDIHLSDFGPWSFVAGLGFLVVCLPVRVGVVLLQRRLGHLETPRQSLRVAATLLPTLVFSLVLSEILHERFALAAPLFGGLVLYTIVNTLLAGPLLRRLPILAATPETTAQDAAPSPEAPVEEVLEGPGSVAE